MGKSQLTKSDNYEKQTDVWYRAYDINNEKIILFHDFLDSLYDITERTYLGEDVMDEETPQRGHFTWCWDRTINNFKKERITFRDRGTHYEYFWILFKESFYNSIIDNEPVSLKSYFFRLFNTDHQKTRSELGVLTEIYKILEKNLT